MDNKQWMRRTLTSKKITKSNQNKGSAAVEASILVPIFLFAMLFFYSLAEIKMAETELFEAAIETSEYMAEYAYLDSHGDILPMLRYEHYVDETDLVGRYVEGGLDSVSFFGSVPLDWDGYVKLKVSFDKKCQNPLIYIPAKGTDFMIYQRAFVGDSFENENASGENNGDEKYVFVTDNREVYHNSRGCTYLQLSVRSVFISTAIDEGYSPCEYCGSSAQGIVIVTDYGNRFHSDAKCSGLKRTVYRVKLSEVSGLPECSRCRKGD